MNRTIPAQAHSIDLVCRLSGGRPKHWLFDLIKRGIVRPAFPGRKGKGGRHYFSGQQLCGLALVDTYLRHGLRARRFFTRLVAAWEGVGDGALLTLARRLTDPTPHDEEADAAAAALDFAKGESWPGQAEL